MYWHNHITDKLVEQSKHSGNRAYNFVNFCILFYMQHKIDQRGAIICPKLSNVLK